MLFKVLAQKLMFSDPLQLGCRTLNSFNGYNKNRKTHPLNIFSRRNTSSSNHLHNASKSDSDEIEAVSLLGIKKQLKNANFEFIDGNCYLKTVCPVCGPPNGLGKQDVYINKTTGKDC